MTWQESLHPRDNIGRFTYKNSASSDSMEAIKGSIEKVVSNNNVLSNILDKLNLGEITSIAIDVIGNLATPAIILYSNIDNLVDIIKDNKLEDKFNNALIKASDKKESNISSGKINVLKDINYKNNKTNNNKDDKTKVKEININYLKNNDKQNDINVRKDKSTKEYRNKLIHMLHGKLKPSEILYSSINELEGKVREYGFEDELGGVIAGGASGIDNYNGQSFARPVEGIIKSDFGPRKAPVPNGSTNHKGIDFRAPIGTPVKSVASGTVIKAGSASGYGIAVYVDHGIINGKHVISEYGHLSKCNVKVGDKINAGQVVAKSGNSGHSSSPHLHLTIKENGKAVDPKKYIKLK